MPTDVLVAIGVGVRPLTGDFVVFKLTDVLVAVADDQRPLTVEFVLFKLTDVIESIGADERPMAVVLVPGHRAWWQRRLSGSNQRQQEQQ